MLDKKFYSHLWALILYIPFVFFIKGFLPKGIVYENGPIENLQVVLLALGVLLCHQSLKKALNKKDKYIWCAGIGFYILLLMRELSFGRALFMRPDGSLPQWNEMGIYGVRTLW